MAADHTLRKRASHEEVANIDSCSFECENVEQNGCRTPDRPFGSMVEQRFWLIETVCSFGP